MLGDEEQDAPALMAHPLDMVGKHLAEMGPAEIELPAEVAKGQEDADQGIGDDGDIDTAMHALNHGDGGGMLGEIAPPGEPGLRAPKVRLVMDGEIEQPVDAFLAGFAVDDPGDRLGMRAGILAGGAPRKAGMGGLMVLD